MVHKKHKSKKGRRGKRHAQDVLNHHVVCYSDEDLASYSTEAPPCGISGDKGKSSIVPLPLWESYVNNRVWSGLRFVVEGKNYPGVSYQDTLRNYLEEYDLDWWLNDKKPLTTHTLEPIPCSCPNYANHQEDERLELERITSLVDGVPIKAWYKPSAVKTHLPKEVQFRVERYGCPQTVVSLGLIIALKDLAKGRETLTEKVARHFGTPVENADEDYALLSHSVVTEEGKEGEDNTLCFIMKLAVRSWVEISPFANNSTIILINEPSDPVVDNVRKLDMRSKFAKVKTPKLGEVKA
ncbi:hypothetical protein DICA4_B02784 [Diutina catenulata]